MKLSNLKIAWRLGLGFGLILILMASITAISVFSSKQQRENLTRSVNSTNAKSAHVSVIRQNLFRQSLAARNIGATTDLNQMQKEMAKIGLERKAYRESEAKLVGIGLNQKEQAIVAEMQEYEKTSLPFV